MELGVFKNFSIWKFEVLTSSIFIGDNESLVPYLVICYKAQTELGSTALHIVWNICTSPTPDDFASFTVT